MTTFSNSPRTLKSGLVLADPETAQVHRIISLRYNPDSLSQHASGSKYRGGRGLLEADAAEPACSEDTEAGSGNRWGRIGLNIAFVAAKGGERVRANHLQRAALVRAAKRERRTTDADARGWV
jgi:hypothetical protein